MYSGPDLNWFMSRTQILSSFVQAVRRWYLSMSLIELLFPVKEQKPVSADYLPIQLFGCPLLSLLQASH